MRIVRISWEVTKASKNNPREMDMDGSSLVAMISGPGKRAEMKPAAVMPAISCAAIVCNARNHWIFRVRNKAAVTYDRKRLVSVTLQVRCACTCSSAGNGVTPG